MKKYLIKYGAVAILAIIAAVALNAPVFAAEGDLKTGTFDVTEVLTVEGDGLLALSQDEPLVYFIGEIINYATWIIGSLSVLMMIIAGFMLMTSEGNEQKLDKGKNLFKYTIIGLLVAFMSYIITLFIQSVFIPEIKP